MPVKLYVAAFKQLFVTTCTFKKKAPKGALNFTINSSASLFPIVFRAVIFCNIFPVIV